MKQDHMAPVLDAATFLLSVCQSLETMTTRDFLVNSRGMAGVRGPGRRNARPRPFPPGEH